MDQLSAHLDRGWELVQRGDARGAEASARRALELDGQSPDAYNLLGYVCALQGEYDDAVEHYRQAIALDDTYLDAMLNAAEVYAHWLNDPESAISMCDQALDLAENDDEVVDALLLKFDALMTHDDVDGAREVCASFPSGPFENPTHAFLVGRALFEVGEVDRAAPLIEAAVKETPTNPDAQYYLGALRDERGDLRGAVEAFLRARDLDAALPPPPWALTRETFLATAERAAAALPAEIRQHLRVDEIFVADAPGLEVVADGVDPRALVLLDGMTQQPGQPPTARVFVYQRNVERVSPGVEQLEEEIRAALDHEVRAVFLDTPPAPPRAAMN